MWENILFLFDIDGTIIKINYAGKKALSYSFNETFQKNNLLKNIDIAGKTDLSTFKKVIQKNNLQLKNDFETYWHKFKTIFAKKLIDLVSDYEWKLITDVDEVLRRIKNNKAKTGLITGNMKEGARIKLEMVSMKKYFPVGAYGDEHISRNNLATTALNRAESYYGQNFSRVIVIGDTPLDIISGKSINASTVAITGGSYTFKKLQKFKPDILVNSYKELLNSKFWAAI
ncbi:MAG: HAD hydrolase-like protein [Candidatus Mcinerneyibacterium aminivorans]|uniref:HAD hydrolase-like protein n=1 Tax=Candidatus Mcinerneyibacterium aminivorans TaxID=2703815 RepID=A0A5D0MM13_9BACT|nr:MAG: HAD hydrolase-like protein [Candidatus Mcinerneyibacterium aminivorans]